MPRSTRGRLLAAAVLTAAVAVVSLGAVAPARADSGASVRVVVRTCTATGPGEVGTTISIGPVRPRAGCTPATGRFTLRWHSGSAVVHADRSGTGAVRLPAAANEGAVRLIDRASGVRTRFSLGPDHRAVVVVTRRLPPSVGGVIPPNNPDPPHPAPPAVHSSTPSAPPTPTAAGTDGGSTSTRTSAAADVRAGGDPGTNDGPSPAVIAVIAAAGLIALALGGWFVVRHGASRAEPPAGS